MTESRVDRIFENYKDLSDESEQFVIRTAILTILATSAEILGSENPDLEGAWSTVDNLLNELLEKDPKSAVEAAVNLMLIPTKDEPISSTHNQYVLWMRTNGLVILGKESARQHLDNYLHSGERKNELSDALSNAMNLDISSFADGTESFTNPLGFTCLQAVYACNFIDPETSQLAGNLHIMAQLKLMMRLSGQP